MISRVPYCPGLRLLYLLFVFLVFSIMSYSAARPMCIDCCRAHLFDNFRDWLSSEFSHFRYLLMLLSMFLAPSSCIAIEI